VACRCVVSCHTSRHASLLQNMHFEWVALARDAQYCPHRHVVRLRIIACRCKVCEACTQNTGSSSRRCLLVRATAAAASGHGGAQLAVLGDKAVGADIEVWWPLDQAWYKGVVSVRWG
jgi:hypothetical protein